MLTRILGLLLQGCYGLLPNYSLAIIAFTLLTKVILFPVSMWMQKNSIKMVRLTPELNELKVKYYGDNDEIAEQTQALYKREKYHPLASTIPMFIQLILLIGVIGAVRTMLEGDADAILAKLPMELGGAGWLVPIAAGAAALLLGLAQNHLNPLQKEQGKAAQWTTNGFSILISLALGAFVPVGVGIYWICSNLFTILQQVLLNVVIPPKKFIDYAALENSKEALKELQAMGQKKRSPEEKKKEKEDYKRFFSIANKHVVFYSERNGFYKYFEGIIDYLLENTNIVIHYVTSDFHDDIFEKEKTNPRLKGYYIGEKKLITLFMKMDADIVVMTMTDLDNFHYKRSYVRKDIEYVYVFHAMCSTHMIYHQGAFDHYDTLFCVGDFIFPEVRRQEELHGLPPKKLIECGYCLLESLRQAYVQMVPMLSDKKRILIAPSWQEGNILDSCLDELLKGLLGRGWEITIRPHPEYVKRYANRMNAIMQRYKDYPSDELVFEMDFTSNESTFASDVVITDWSGIAFEFSFVTGKPTVFIDTPRKIHNSEFESMGIVPIEVKLRDKIGIRLDPRYLESVGEKIQEAMDNKDNYKEAIFQTRDQTIANFGHSGEIGGKYIISSLKEKIAKRKNEENRQ